MWRITIGGNPIAQSSTALDKLNKKMWHMLKNATNSASMQVIKIAGWPDVMAISSAGIC